MGGPTSEAELEVLRPPEGAVHRIVGVHPDAAGRLERPLLAKLVRRLQYLPRRNVRIDHPDNDIVTNALLTEANFTVQRTLTHMRLDLSR